jgi:glyoxylase-like metal-dependent hydrolase (beta-lactamase superfamily II)
MTLVEVAEGVHRLTQGVVNFYLLADSGKLTLIDAGAPGDWDVFARAVTSLGRTLEDLDAVLLTHAHSDHTGFAERARTEAHATVRIHRADEEMARSGRAPKNQAGVGRYLIRPEAYRTLFGLMRRKGLKVIPIHEVSVFEDGETLDVPGGPRVVHAPGHTDGSCAILLEERRVLVTGDVLSTRNPLTGRVGPQIAPDGLNRDSDLALRSLDALTAVPADMVLPGHGEPWTGGVAEAVRLAKVAGRS